jgi:ribosomal protein S18 acetylase RimI-like enzyme
LAAPARKENLIVLRPITPEDDSFLASLYASTRADELAITGWSEEQKAMFCRMQFAAQSADYQRNYPDASFQIIERSGVAAGRLLVLRSNEAIHVIDIALLPEHRGAGIGTKLLKELQQEAKAAGKPLTIHVERFNPALRLYERLGFKQVEEKEVYLLMEWRGDGASREGHKGRKGIG